MKYAFAGFFAFLAFVASGMFSVILGLFIKDHEAYAAYVLLIASGLLVVIPLIIAVALLFSGLCDEASK